MRVVCHGPTGIHEQSPLVTRAKRTESRLRRACEGSRWSLAARGWRTRLEMASKAALEATFACQEQPAARDAADESD